MTSFDLSLAVKARTGTTLALGANLMTRPQNDDGQVPHSRVYEQALTLREATKASLVAVTTKKGPAALPSRVDTWLNTYDAVVLLPVIGGIVSIGGGFASFGEVPKLASAALFGAGIALWGYARHIARADKRLKAAVEHHASEQLDSKDVERMLQPYLAAPAEQRAVLKPYVDSMIGPFAGNLSAKASIMLERLASELPTLENQSVELRASRLALIVGELLDGVSLNTHIAELGQVVDACPPAERKVVAGLLEQTLFQSEKSNVAGTQHEIKMLYRIVERAYRGEGAPASEAHSE